MKSSEELLRPDARELILGQDQRYVCETYIFEPASRERSLGYLFAVGETEDREGVGRELLDLVISAIQHEYYRDANRSSARSFESALHQANIILHDSAQQQVTGWMTNFHVALCALAGSTLQISSAGQAVIYLARNRYVSCLSEGLALGAIADPLQTFSQVASGTLAAHDILWLGTASFSAVFGSQNLIRFSYDPSAANIAANMQHVYAEQLSKVSLATLVISLPPHAVLVVDHGAAAIHRPSRSPLSVSPASLRPRKPLIIQRSRWSNMLFIGTRLLTMLTAYLRRSVWPLIKKSSLHIGSQAKQFGQQAHHVGRTVISYQRNAMLNFTPRRLTLRHVRSLPRFLLTSLANWVRALPTSSKVFALLASLLAMALLGSLLLLQHKRAKDSEFERASEILHEARTKQEAAAQALIYDNRDQAQKLLEETEKLTHALATTTLYEEARKQLVAENLTLRDRLQRIIRAGAASVRTIGDFGSAITQESPRSLFYINDRLYTYNPANNAIMKMDLNGTVASASQNSPGDIGFFQQGIVHLADKSIILATDAAGIVIFDTKDETLHKQDISLADKTSRIKSLAVFGNRLYIYEPQAKNIFVWQKSLRGYVNGSPWITDAQFAKDGISSIAVDGNVFTLQQDGSIHRLYKGAEAEFTREKVDPSLPGSARLITSEELHAIYVFDPAGKRLVIFSKKGALQNQLFLDDFTQLTDIAIPPDEKTLYVLDGTKVLAVPLEEALPNKKQ